MERLARFQRVLFLCAILHRVELSALHKACCYVPEYREHILPRSHPDAGREIEAYAETLDQLDGEEKPLLPRLEGLVERGRLTRYATPAEFKVGKKTVAYSPDQRARKAERARERYQEKKRALAEAGGAGETKSPSLRSSARVGWVVDPQR
jgi:hypothetical protein